MGELKDVTVVGNADSKVRFVTTADSKLENVTIKNVPFEFSGSSKYDAFICINADAQIDNLVVENCSISGNDTKGSYGIYGQNPNATIVVKNCTFSNMGYPIQTQSAGGYKSMTIDNCTFSDLKSWAIMIQYNNYEGNLFVTNCNFVNCANGLARIGNFTEGHTFQFTNNTIVNSAEHPAKKWFEVNASAATKVISGNTKDGAEWTPGEAEGLK